MNLPGSGSSSDQERRSYSRWLQKEHPVRPRDHVFNRPSALALAPVRNVFVEGGRAAARHAERFPICRLQMLREKDDLSQVTAVVRYLSIDCLQNRVALAPNEGLAREVRI